MWKTINPGDHVTLGDTVRYQPSSYHSSFREKIYQVVKTEQHYFEISVKPDKEEIAERRIIKYIDIGYHLGVEVWLESTIA
jgi:predicted DNA-binding protein (MmcQ/YjbR family)